MVLDKLFSLCEKINVPSFASAKECFFFTSRQILFFDKENFTENSSLIISMYKLQIKYNGIVVPFNINNSNPARK